MWGPAKAARPMPFGASRWPVVPQRPVSGASRARTGTDKQGLTPSLRVTDAGQADITQMSDLLHGEEREV
jgi:hypothetical protein